MEEFGLEGEIVSCPCPCGGSWNLKLTPACHTVFTTGGQARGAVGSTSAMPSGSRVHAQVPSTLSPLLDLVSSAAEGLGRTSAGSSFESQRCVADF